MASREMIDLYIKVTDSGGEASFKKIGRAAADMGKAVEGGAKQGERGLKAIQSSAEETSKSFTKIGASIGGAVGALSKLGQSAVTEANSIRGIERAYGDASGGILEFSRNLQASTIYTDDAGRQAAQLASTLARNYDISTQQIEQLITRSADLAAVSLTESGGQFSLADAVQRTSSAIRGEAESAEALGLTLNDAAVARYAATQGITNYATGLDEVGRAQVRFQYFLEQSTFAEGAAAAQADTVAGKTQQLLNRVQDLGQSFGALTGPVGQSASVLSEVAIALPVVGGAAGKAAGALKGLGPAIAGLRAESALASVALGPVGLVAAGIAGVVMLGELTDWFGLAGDKADKVVAPIDRVSEALFAMAQAGSDAQLIGQLQGITNAVFDEMERAGETAEQVKPQLDAASAALEDLRYRLTQPISAPVNADTNWNTINQQIADQEALVASLTARYESLTGATTDYNQSQELLSALYQRADDPLVNRTKLLADLEAATATLADTHDFDAYNAALQRITDNFAAWYGVMPPLTFALDANANSLATNTNQIGANTLAIGPQTDAREATTAVTITSTSAISANTGALGGNTVAIAANAAARHQHRTAVDEDNAANGRHNDEQRHTGPLFDSLNEKLATGTTLFGLNAQAVQEWAARADEASQSAIEFIGNADNILQVLYDAGKGLSGSQGFIRDVIDLQQSLSALDSTYSIIIDGSDHLGQTSQKLADHYGELVGVVREANGAIWYQTSLIDDLAGRGVIGWQEYNAAVAATTQILNDNARVQDAIGKIQIDQAPYLANLNAETADYVTNLSHQDAQQQRNVLTLMDANSQQQLAALYSLATADAMGELGENGGQYVQDMVDGLRITNPLLYDYLQTSGAIDSNGVFQFDEGDAASLLSVIGDLDSTIQDLNLSIAMLTGDPFLIAAAKADILADHIRGAKDGLQLLHDLSTRPDFGAFPTVSTAYTPAPPQPGGGGSVASSPAPREGPVLQLPGEKAGAVLLTADNTAVLRTIAETRGVLHSELIDPPWTAHIDLGNRLATSATMELGRIIHTVVDPTYTAVIDGDPSGALTGTATASSALGAIDGDSATLYIYGDRSPLDNVIAGINGSILGVGYISIQGIPGPGMSAPPGSYATGGTVIPDMPHYASGGTYAMVGEAGPEMVWMSRGDQVTNAAATASRMRGRGGGGGIVNYGPVYIYPATTDVEGAFTAAFYGSNR